MSGRLIMPGQGNERNLAAIAGQLNRAFAEINEQVGKLAPGGDVIVGYIVSGVAPSITNPGALGVNVRFLTRAPVCLVKGEDGQPCGEQATFATPPNTFLCERHALLLPEGTKIDAIEDIVASMQASLKGNGEGGAPK